MMGINKTIFFPFIIVISLTSCASSGGGARKIDLNNPNLDNPYLVSSLLSSDSTKKFEKEIDEHKAKYKLVYIDTRPVELYRKDILKGIQSARSFGRSIGRRNVLFVPKVKSQKKLEFFSRLSKDFHDKYIGNKYSYKEAPFLVSLDGYSATHVVPFTGLSHECRVKFLSDLEQSVRTNVFNEKVSNRYYSAIDSSICEIPGVIKNTSHIEKIVRFLKSIFS